MATEIKSWNPLTDIQVPFAWRQPGWVRIEDDVFAPGVKDQDIDKVLAVVAMRPHLRVIMPTAHTDRMAGYFLAIDGGSAWNRSRGWTWDGSRLVACSGRAQAWPLPNLMPGAIVEDQATANERIPHLMACPAKLRMVDARLRGEIKLIDVDNGVFEPAECWNNWCVAIASERP